MKKTLTFSLLFILLIFNSCTSYLVNKVGLNEKNPICKILKIEDKEVYFLGMMHLATNEFYENVKKINEDFEKRGFVFFVEGVSKKSEIKDTFSIKKVRKLTGLDLTIKYSKNQILSNIINKYKLVDQPKYNELGLLNYSIIDLSASEMIEIYEKKYNPVLLDSCDLNTKLGDPYKCKLNSSIRNIFTKEIIFNERNKHVLNAIINSNHKKIVVIYGKEHYDGIVKEIESLKYQ